MRMKFALVLLASAATACTTTGDPAARGVEAINQPVMSRATFALDLAAPGGNLSPAEGARLDEWFRTLGLGYGDSIFVEGAYAEPARSQVAAIAGRYGLLVQSAAPVTAGMLQQDMVRVIVSRTRAEVPGCPNWSVESQPNSSNHTSANFGCSVNSNLAAMVANPQDLFHGREGSGVGDALTATKAVDYYRKSEPTGTKGLQDLSTKED